MSCEFHYIEGTYSKETEYKINSIESNAISLSPTKTKDIHLDTIIDGVKYRYNPYIEIPHIDYHKIMVLNMNGILNAYIDYVYYLTENDLLKYFEKVEENE